jgi:hypothetical protein
LPNWHGDTHRRDEAAGPQRVQAPSDPAQLLERFVHSVLVPSVPNSCTPDFVRSQGKRKWSWMSDPLRARSKLAVAIVLLLAAGFTGCAHREYFPGTTIVRSEENRKIIETVEQYRQRLLTRNTVGLLALASPRYFEDSGTPRSDDDYEYDGLKQVLQVRLQRVKSLRYEIEYRNIRVTGTEAEVEVFLDGSFELAAPEAGDRYRRVNDYHRFLLEKDGDEWKFLAGM